MVSEGGSEVCQGAPDQGGTERRTGNPKAQRRRTARNGATSEIIIGGRFGEGGSGAEVETIGGALSKMYSGSGSGSVESNSDV
jgi:hypothetical protein